MQGLCIPVGLSDVRGSSFLPDTEHCIVVDLRATLGPSLDVWQTSLGFRHAVVSQRNQILQFTIGGAKSMGNYRTNVLQGDLKSSAPG